MAQVLGPSTAHNRQDGRAVEEIYQKKTQLEHILLRPDTYIGSIEHQDQTLWVHDGERMVVKSISYVPGLYKIFDEILVNAADNKVRDSTMDSIKVDVDEVLPPKAATASKHQANVMESFVSFEICLAKGSVVLIVDKAVALLPAAISG